MSDAVRLFDQPRLSAPTLVVGWATDAARFGSRVTDYLVRKLGGVPFGEIAPTEFFQLEGVTVANDLVLFPDSRFWACGDNLIVFRSPPPDYQWFRFLNLILDVAAEHKVKEVYTTGSMVTLGPHTVPRQFFGTVNTPQFKEELTPYGLTREVNYESPPGAKPTLSSFFLWTAQRRQIAGANLWVPVPFYLVASEDPAAYRPPLGFLNQRLGLGLDLSDLDLEAGRLNDRLDRVRAEKPETDAAIRKLETGNRLDEGEGDRLAQAVEAALRDA